MLVEEEMFLILCVYLPLPLCLQGSKEEDCCWVNQSRSIILLFESAFWLGSQVLYGKGTSLIMNESFFAGSGTDG